jgi:hypothetical protein
MKTKRSKISLKRWRELVQEWETSQMSAKAWCRKHAIPYVSFIVWRKRLKCMPQDKLTVTQPSFVELLEPAPVASGVEIRCRDLHLSLRPNFDTTTLLRCLQVLEAL